ncbi:MAG: hypothetical protein VX529_10660 [Pseudomonadota bacterium]|nr:hypothetical protein [Pseudomonadota bacterium]
MSIPNDIPSPADFEHELAALALEAKAFEGAEIDAKSAEKVGEIIDRARKLAKRIEDARKIAKDPHLKAGQKVDAEFKPTIASAEKIAADSKKLLQPFLVAEQKRRDAEAAEARRKAEALRDDALLADRAQSQAKEAEKVAASAHKVQSSSGSARTISLRTVRSAEVTDAAALVEHYAAHPAIIAEAERLANADIRAAKGAAITIPGVKIHEEQVAA